MMLFASGLSDWPEVVIVGCQVVIALGTAILTGLGWKRRNGWYAPKRRRKSSRSLPRRKVTSKKRRGRPT